MDKPSLCIAMKNSGRRVARLPAVMARPCSTEDQMAMSSVDPDEISKSHNRESGELTEEVWRVEVVDER